MPEGGARANGSVEEEAQRLVQAAGEWLRTHREAAAADPTEVDPQDGVADADGAQDHTQDHTTCQGCPWCRAKAAWGDNGSDTLESLADLLASASESLRLYARNRRGEEAE